MVPFTGLSRLPDDSIDRKRYRAWMMSDSDYRRLAAECLELAQRMSLHRDRAHLMEMAQRWLGLAAEAERQPSGANNHAIERAV